MRELATVHVLMRDPRAGERGYKSKVLSARYILKFTEDILMALLCAADTGVYGLTGVAVAPLVSGGAPDVLEEAKLTPKFDGSASEVASGPMGTLSSSDLSPLGTVDSIFTKF